MKPIGAGELAANSTPAKLYPAAYQRFCPVCLPGFLPHVVIAQALRHRFSARNSLVMCESMPSNADSHLRDWTPAIWR